MSITFEISARFRPSAECRLYDQPEVTDWLESHPDEASTLSQNQIDLLYSLFGTGGPNTPEGVGSAFSLIKIVERMQRQFDTVVWVASARAELSAVLERLYNQVNIVPRRPAA